MKDQDQVWNTSSSAWENTSKYDLTYNASGQITQEVVQKWNISSAAWVNENKYNKTYFPNGCLQYADTYSWNTTTNVWDAHKQTEYFQPDINDRVESPSLQAVNCFPNPVSQTVTINFPLVESNNGEIRILDVMGKEVYRSNVHESSSQIDVSKFHNGVYFVQLTSDNKTVTQKLIVEH